MKIAVLALAGALATRLAFARRIAFALHLFALLALSAPLASAATVILRVNPAATGSADGATWATAYRDLQTALVFASPTAENPVEIWIATGVYKPGTSTARDAHFALKDHLTLRGGFLGTESTAAARPASATATAFTVLSGDIGTSQPDAITAATNVNDLAARAFDITSAGAKDNSFNVLRAFGITATLDRLVIAGGYADSPAVSIAQIETQLNPAIADGPGFQEPIDVRVNGGGLFASNSHLTLTDCWFVGNFAKGIGGGMVMRGGTLLAHDNRFIRNVTGYGGGGLCAQAVGYHAFDRNTFYGNTSAYLGGGFLVQADTDNKYVKAYEANLLTGLAALTFEDPLATPAPDTQTDPSTPYDQAKLIKAGRKIAQTLSTIAKEKSGLIAPKLTVSPLQLYATNSVRPFYSTASGTSSSFAVKGVGSALGGAYSWVSFGVSAVDFGVQLALLLGADPNDPFIRGWTSFSDGFAAYATPLGIAKTIYTAIIGSIPGPSFEQRATERRIAEYDANHNQSDTNVFRQNIFERNYADGFGGATLVLRHNLTFSRARFVENEAGYGGGAGAFFAYNTVGLENSVLLRNRSTFGHSVLATGYRNVSRLYYNTFTGNHSASTSGFAIGADAGADVTIVNSILWANTNGPLADSANPNRQGGADLFATRRVDLDEGGLKAYNDAGDSRGMFTGIIEVLSSTVQSLPRLPLGTEAFHAAGGGFQNARDYGYLPQSEWPNVGEGIAPVSTRSSISSDPLLIQEIYPHPRSPVHNAATNKVLMADYYSGDYLGNRDRDSNATKDIGAIESDGTLPNGTIIYVNHLRPSSGDGLSWATAFKTLPEALAQPLNPGAQIWVAQGTYTVGSTRDQKLVLRPGVSLIGSFNNFGGSGPFATSENESDPALYPTIVSGQIGSASADDNSHVLLEGRYFPPNGTDPGLTWALYESARSLPRVLRNLHFADATNGLGTAAVRLAVPFVIDNCRFTGHRGARALFVDDTANLRDTASGRIQDTIFDTNLAGAIACSAFNLDILRSRFYDNVADLGAGLTMTAGLGSSLKLERNVFHNNTATAGRGGAVFFSGYDLIAAHNVFVDNFATPAPSDPGLHGGAGLLWNAPDLIRITRFTLRNNIFYGNRILGPLATSTPLDLQQLVVPTFPSSLSPSIVARIDPVIGTNNIEGLRTVASRGGANGNYDYDPFFVNLGARDYRLGDSSLLLNVGSSYDSFGTDAATTLTGPPDLGVFESTNPTPNVPHPLSQTVAKPTDAGRVFTFSGPSYLADTNNHSFVWEVLRPGNGGWITVPADAYTSGLGTYTLTLQNPPYAWDGSLYRIRFTSYGRPSYTTEQTLLAPPSILYVRTAATGSGDGTTWNNAASLSQALSLAQPYTQLWLAAGTYDLASTLRIPPGVRLYGGFFGSETALAQRTPGFFQSYLRPTTSARLFTVDGTATWPADSSAISTVIDRVTIRPRSTTGGSLEALRLGYADTVFNDVVFNCANTALSVDRGKLVVTRSTFSGMTSGVPVYVQHAQVTVTDTTFSANIADRAGAIYALNTSLHIARSTFAGNRSSAVGAISVDDSAVVITDTTFTGNSGGEAGALRLTFSTSSLDLQRSRFLDNSTSGAGGAIQFHSVNHPGRIANSLFARNRASTSGGAIVLYGYAQSPLAVTQATFAENSAGNHAAALDASNSSARLVNSIVWGNTVDKADAKNAPFYGTVTATNSHLQGQAVFAPFFDPASPDHYALAPYSPLLNLGGTDNTVSGLTDLVGAPRRHASGPADLGASEFAGTPSTPVYLTAAPANQTVYVERPVTFAVAGTIGTTTGTTALTWQYLDGATWRPVADFPGWTTTATPTGSTLAFPAATLAMNGLQLRPTAPGLSGGLGTVTLTVLPRKILRVDARAATTTGDGSSWPTAFQSLATALAAADRDTDLWVAAGDYPEPTLTVPASATGSRYYPGFLGTETTLAERPTSPASIVRLTGPAGTLELVATGESTLPAVTAVRLVSAPADFTRYVEKAATFTARHNGTVPAPLTWQFRDGSTWQPIANRPGWVVTTQGDTSTLTHPAIPQTDDGLIFRAIAPDAPEASFTATLDVKPRHVLRVDSRVASSGDGSTWPLAFKTLSEALAASDEGTDLWIATGNYAERNFPLVPGALFYTGFDGTESTLAERSTTPGLVNLFGPASQVELAPGVIEPLRYHLAGPVRTRPGYIGQPVSLTVNRAAWSSATFQWQYQDGSTWLPVTNLAGWVSSSSGSTVTLYHPALPVSADGLRVRVSVLGAGEVSFPVTLGVTPRLALRVDGGVASSGDGSSWSSAFKTIAEALAFADDGTDLWIAAGTYDEDTLSVGSGVKLYGGFAGTENTLAGRDPAAHPVVLTNVSDATVLHIDPNDAEFTVLTVVDGVSIESSASEASPGVFVTGAAVVELQNVAFRQNRIALRVSDTANVTVEASTFDQNTQAIVLDSGASLTVLDSTFTTNPQGITSSSGADLLIIGSAFSGHSDYALQAAPGFALELSTFIGDARSVLVAGPGTAPTALKGNTFTAATVVAVRSPTRLDLSDNSFAGNLLGLDLTTPAAASSTLLRDEFENHPTAVTSPAGLTVTDATFSDNTLGLVLSAGATDAVTSATGTTFSNHTEAGLRSSGPLVVTDATFSGNALGLDVLAAPDRVRVATSAFSANTIGASSAPGLTIANTTFTGDATSLRLTAGTLGSTLDHVTFSGATVVGLQSASRVAVTDSTFSSNVLGASLTGGSGVSRFATTTFTGNTSGLAVTTPARVEVTGGTFSGHTATAFAATGSSAPTATDILVTDTLFTTNSGLAYAQTAGRASFDRIRFLANTPATSVVSLTGSTAHTLSFVNTLVAKNAATSGGATLHATGGTIHIHNSTIADNDTGTVAGALGGASLGSIRVAQSILWDNHASGTLARPELLQADPACVSINTSFIQGLQYTAAWIAPSALNVSYDPLFTDPASNDYRLDRYSAALDSGGILHDTPLDLAGQPRFTGPLDLGAYESPFARAALPLRVSFPSGPRTIVVGDAVTYSASFTATPDRAIRWQVDTGSGFADLAANAYHAFNYANGVLRLVVQGDPALSGHRYRAVVSENGSDLYSSPASTFSVVARPIFHVDASATGAGTGTTWADAFTDLSAALAAAPAFSDIRVAAGTYRAPANDSFQLRRRQRLLGGWDAATSTRDPAAHLTVLSSAVGAPSTSVILQANSDQGVVDKLTTLDGFTFRQGGTGLLLPFASPVVRACVFENLATGIILNNGQLRLEDSTFTGNSASALIARGGDADLEILNCTFTNNQGSALVLGDPVQANSGSQTLLLADSTFTGNSGIRGGALHSLQLGNVHRIERSTFVGNTATELGGALSTNVNSSLLIRQSLFAENQAPGASAIHASGTLDVSFSTVADNITTGTTTRAALYTSRTLALRDSILWGNTAPAPGTLESAQLRADQGLTASDSVIQGLATLSGTRLLPFDPKFADAPNGDYRLAATSPAIGFANPADLLSGETDLLDVTRPAGAAPDLGAYESAATPAPAYTFDLPTSLSGHAGTTLTLPAISPAGFGHSWDYFNGTAWVPLNQTIYSPLRSLPGADRAYDLVLPGSRDTTLTFADISAPLHGLQVRLTLGYQGTNYVSHPVTVNVTGFEVIHVDASVPASGDGRSWSTAFKTLPEAFAAIDSARRVLWLAEGTYRGPFELPLTTEVYGGFPAGGAAFASRDPSAHPTVLTGLPAIEGQPRAAAVLTLLKTGPATAQPVLDGLVIEDGRTGLLSAENVSPLLRRLVVRGHTETGVVLQTSTARLEDSVLENNSGINGGALRATGGSITLERVTVRGNSATLGGGLYLNDHSVLRSVLLSGNVADTGGALYLFGNPRLDQVTVAANRARVASAAHVQFGAATLRNSLVWGNRADDGSDLAQLAANSANLPAAYVLDRVVVEQTTLSTGVLRHDPVFVSAVPAASAPTVTGDYRLRAVSPAIDAGNDAFASGLTLDLAGLPRFTGTVDLGAYESATAALAQPLAITTQPASLAYRRSGSANTFTVAATGASSVLWQYFSGGAWLTLDGVPGWTGATTATLAISSASPVLNGTRIRAVITSADGSSVVTDPQTLTVLTPRYYVNAAASAPGDGLSWATAFKSLDTALATIPYDIEGTELWLGAGTYTPANAFRLSSGLALYGGFAGTETSLAERDPAAHVTALVGAAAQPVVVSVLATNGSSPALRLDGLTVRDSAGLGLDNPSGRPLVIENVRFLNLARALNQRGGTLAIRYSEFRGNGGASVDGAALSALYTATTLENTLFAGNRSTYTSAASFYGGPVLLRHVTFAHNFGQKAALFGDANTQLYNTIFWGNRDAADKPVSFSSTGQLYVARNNLAESLTPFTAFFPIRSGNLTADPFFLSPVAASAAPTTAGDYRLGDSSLAIDSGLNSESTAFDLAGLPRPSGLHSDPGAYENQASGLYTLTTQPVDTVASATTPAVFTVAASRPASFTWEVSTDSGATYTPVSSGSSLLTVPGAPSIDGHLYRARVQFATGPELVSTAATVSYLDVAVTADLPGGFATPRTFTASANASIASYQWQLSVAGAPFADVSGANASTLSVLGDASFTNRTYRVRATFTAGPVVPSNTVAFTYADSIPAPASTGTASSLAFSLPGGVQPASLTDASLFVHAALTGRLALADLAAPVFTGDDLTLDFASSLHAGERVRVTTTSALRRADGIGTRPHVWEFRAATSSGIGIFDTAVPVGATAATAFALGDLDSDGTLDALVATTSGLQAYANDGLAAFTPAVPAFASPGVTALALGSLTPSGALDAAVINASGDIEVWTNDASAAFTLAQTLPTANALSLALGDLDADGDLDLLVGTATGARVYLNNGSAAFTAGPVFGSASATSVALGDLDLDGDLDAVTASASATAVWLNDSSASFTSGFTTTPGATRLALADFDADGRLDLILARPNAPARLLRNLGAATFQTLAASPGGGLATLATGDLDSDGRADLVLTDATGATGPWLGSSLPAPGSPLLFTRTVGQTALTFGPDIDLADLDGDGALDLFGLSPSGQPAASLYRITPNPTDEDTDVVLTALPSTVHLLSLPAHGTLLTADSSPLPALGDQLPLAALPLTYRPAADFNGLDSFTWSATSGGPALSTWLLVRPVADAVVAVADSFTVAQGASASAEPSLLVNDTNNDAGTLASTLLTQPAHGTLSLGTDGTFTYVHDNSESRADSFTYRATNLTSGASDVASVAITITNVNAAPTALSLTPAPGVHYTGRPSGETVATLLGLDPDPEDASTLAYALVSGTGDSDNADFTLDGLNLLTAVPIDATTGLTRSVRIAVTDTNNLSFERTFILAFTRAPSASDISTDTAEDTPVTVTLSALGGAAPLAYELLDAPAHGTLSGTAPALTYTPFADFNGTDSFTYRVTDGTLTSATATASLTVTAVNDTPVLAPAAPVTLAEDTFATFTLAATDTESGSLTYALVGSASLGTVSITGDEVTYTPHADVFGAETLVFTATDGAATSAPVQVAIVITNVNDAPVLAPVDPLAILHSRSASFVPDLTDIDSGPLTVRVGTPPAVGTVQTSLSQVTYLPPLGFTGTISYTVIANDGTLDSNEITVQVTITDPAPVAFSDTVSGDQRTTFDFSLVGQDVQQDPLTFAILTSPAHGTLAKTLAFGPGEFQREFYTYTPDASFSGTDSLTYTVTDAGGNVSATATITFEVARVNLLPVASDQSLTASGLLAANFPLTLSATEPEGQTLTYRIVTPPAQGVLTGDGLTPNFTYVANTSPLIGTDSFTFVANDGEADSAPATVTLTWVKDDHDPVAVPDTAVIYRGLSDFIDVLANDSDSWNDALHLYGLTQPAHGTVSVQGTRILYAHDGGPSTTDSFTYNVSNFSGFVENVTVTVTLRDHVIDVINADDSGPGSLREALATVTRFATTPVAGSADPLTGFPTPATWLVRLNLPDLPALTVGEDDATYGRSAYFVSGKLTLRPNGVARAALRRAELAPPMRLFHFGPQARVTLEDLDLSDGIAHLGGAIYNEGYVTLEGVTLSANTATSAASLAEDSTPGLGGALFQHNGALKLFDTVFTDNVADHGGGLYQLGDGALAGPVSTTADPLYNARSVIIADGALFSGHGSALDYVSATVNSGSADLLALDLTSESHPAPWLAPVPDDVARTQYSATIPVLLAPGGAVTLQNISGEVTGSGDTRTLLGFSTPSALPGYEPTATASHPDGVTFRRQFTYSFDENANHPPVARADHFAASARYQATLLDVLANDQDIDGDNIVITGFTQPADIYEAGYVELNSSATRISFTPYGPLDGRLVTFTYTVNDGSTATVTVRLGATTLDVADESALREAISLANAYPLDTWTVRPTAVDLTLAAAGHTDPVLGASAFHVTGRLVLDGSALTDATLRRATDAPAFRLFHVAPSASLTLQNLTLANGSAPRGGAIYNHSGTVLLEHVTLTGHTATAASETAPGLGGALFTASGTATLRDSVLELNSALDASASAFGLGAAIYQRDGTLALERTSLTDNVSHNAGGLYIEGATSATTHLTESYLDNPNSIADLSATGTANIFRTDSVIVRIGGPSVSPVTDQFIGANALAPATTGTVVFTASDELSGLVLSATSSNQAVLPDHGMVIQTDGNIHRLVISPALSGLTDITLVAAVGDVRFHEQFRLAANTGASVPLVAYPQVGELYPQETTVVDVINGVAPPVDPIGLAMTVVAVGTPAHGTATITPDGLGIRYTHTDVTQVPLNTGAPDDEFTYTVSNGFGGIATHSVGIFLKSSERTVTQLHELNEALDLANQHPSAPWVIHIVTSADTTWTLQGFYSGDESDGFYSARRIAANVTLDASASSGFSLFVPPGGMFGPPARLFLVTATGSLHLKSLRLLDGSAYSFGVPATGGAVLNQGTFTAENVTFSNNRGYGDTNHGGALYNDGGTVSLTHCAFTNNNATTGGAIYSRNGALSLDSVTFSDNTAATAPDVYILGDGATATVSFTRTTAPAYLFATLNGGSVSAAGLPVLGADTVIRPPGKTLKIALPALYANDTGITGATLSVSPVSAQGVTLTRSGNFLLYAAPALLAADDSFTYTLTDAFGFNDTATVTVHIDVPTPTPTATTLSIAVREGSGFTLRLVGVPGRLYTIQVSTDLTNWSQLATATADAQGLYTIEDPVTPPPGTGRFYRAAYNE